MPGKWTFRKLLPLGMTGIQLVLLSVSLAQKWHMTSNPAELHRKFPPTAQRHSGDQGETVSFGPEPTTSTLFKVATALSLPAMFCGVIVGLPLLLLLKIEGGEAFWIGISALLGLFMWWRIGRWADEQRSIAHGILPKRHAWRLAGRMLLRILVYSFLALFLLSLVMSHRLTTESQFLRATWIAWIGGYLLLSFWGERREMRLAQAQEAICRSDGS